MYCVLYVYPFFSSPLFWYPPKKRPPLPFKNDRSNKRFLPQTGGSSEPSCLAKRRWGFRRQGTERPDLGRAAALTVPWGHEVGDGLLPTHRSGQSPLLGGKNSGIPTWNLRNKLYIEATNSHEPSWGGVDSKRKRTYTNVNIALYRIHFPDNCDFESAKLYICTWNWCS